MEGRPVKTRQGDHQRQGGQDRRGGQGHDAQGGHEKRGAQTAAAPTPSREEKKRADAEMRRQQRADQARRSAIDQLESRIAETEREIREIEQTMSAPGFYEDRTAAQPIIDRHQALMWQVGDLMRQWEDLHTSSAHSS